MNQAKDFAEKAVADNASRIDITKDVLDQWASIVRAQTSQITDLRNRVEETDRLHRNCENDLIDVKQRLAVLESAAIHSPKMEELSARLTQVTESIESRVKNGG